MPTKLSSDYFILARKETENIGSGAPACMFSLGVKADECHRLAGLGFPINELIPTQGYVVFIVTANLLLIPVAMHLRKKSIGRMISLAVLLGGAAAVFFTFPLS